MAWKRCRYCSMMIPEHAIVCPHCRKRYCLSLFKKIFLVVIGAGMIANIAVKKDEVVNNTSPDSPSTYKANSTAESGLKCSASVSPPVNKAIYAK